MTGKPALLSLINYRGDPINGIFSLIIHSSSRESRCRLRISGPGFSQDVEFQATEMIKLPLALMPGATELQFHWLGPVTQNPDNPK